MSEDELFMAIEAANHEANIWERNQQLQARITALEGALRGLVDANPEWKSLYCPDGCYRWYCLHCKQVKKDGHRDDCPRSNALAVLDELEG